MSRPLGPIVFTRRDGRHVLVAAEDISTVHEIPGNDDVPNQCRITLKGSHYYEAIDVVEPILEIYDSWMDVVDHRAHREALT